MSATPLSIRLPERTIGRLADRAGRSSMAPRTLAQRYVEEGLRMDDHPLVRYADGPAGRRARLIGGPAGYSQSSPLTRSLSPGWAASFCSSAATIRPVSALVRRYEPGMNTMP